MLHITLLVLRACSLPQRYPEPNDEGFAVWTSTMRRTAMTTRKMLNVWDVIKWRALDEIDAGVMDGKNLLNIFGSLDFQNEDKMLREQ